jgi:hypothetical protein
MRCIKSSKSKPDLIQSIARLRAVPAVVRFPVAKASSCSSISCYETRRGPRNGNGPIGTIAPKEDRPRERTFKNRSGASCLLEIPTPPPMSRTPVDGYARSTPVFGQAEAHVAFAWKNDRGGTRPVVVIRFCEPLGMFARYVAQRCGGGSLRIN